MRTGVPALRLWLLGVASGAMLLGCAAGASRRAPTRDETLADAFAAAAATSGQSPGRTLGQSEHARLRDEVDTAERAFAKTMADRNIKAFETFIADDAIFMASPAPLRGKAQIVAAWKRYYDQSAAPFSWQPEQVAVLDDGTLALSTGPVRDGSGRLVGAYSSVWRRSGTDTWRVIFNVGTETCACTR